VINAIFCEKINLSLPTVPRT